MLNIFSNKMPTEHHTHLFFQAVFFCSQFVVWQRTVAQFLQVWFLIKRWGETVGDLKKWPIFAFIKMTMYVKWAADQAEYQNDTREHQNGFCWTQKASIFNQALKSFHSCYGN